MSLFATRGEMWAFLAVACALAIIVALLLAGCPQLPQPRKSCPQTLKKPSIDGQST